MKEKPTYEELEQRLKELETQAIEFRGPGQALKDKERNVPGAIEHLKDFTDHNQMDDEQKKAIERINRLNLLREKLLSSASLKERLKWVTEGVVSIFKADFCRVWISNPGDLCELGCFHAEVTEGPHVCRYRDSCLHLIASSGRYTHLDGEHRRVPFGAYKIGRVASGEDSDFVTNNVIEDPRVHDRDWARDNGLVSFAGYRLISTQGEPIGVLALFSKKPISLNEHALLKGVANTTAQVIQTTTAQELLRNSEEKYRHLFNSGNDAVLVHLLSETGVFRTFIDVNEMACKLYGYSREEFLNLTPNAIDKKISEEKRDEIKKRLLANEKFIFETDHITKDGSMFPVEVSTNVIMLDGKRAVYSIVRDITERKKAERSLKESLESMKFFAYSIIHDLKSPTIGLYGLTRQLKDRYQDILDEKGQKFCDLIIDASKQISKLVEQINIYISNKELPLKIEQVDITEVLQIVKEEFSDQINIRGITWSVPENLPKINVHRLAIIRIFRNLIDNSLKYAGEELSELKIGYKESNQFHIFSLQDDGIGIKEEDSAKIFQVFKREEASIGTSGTGLGLAIVKEIVERHMGKVWVGQGDEKGLIFYFTISKSL